ncbi:hypothetical protein HMPREF1986_00150 [Oribacterium sp. oral taxon 078 str. F0263]|uniref:PcfB family protein n=1 Tax=Oribacterium sp. oral taxon 078 TaxID=652706 RepID=UPI0003AE509B|nr:PcfB family protein [Oribacterium sp. oral taxon 078]ERL22974.1 hypothetical protein HMPREF1986_00150 [Oribacterium sp. oral taxon 078 str. F0263]
MQEEVESRTVNLAISTTKLTIRTVISAGQAYLRHRKELAAQKSGEKPTGKQTVQELIGQNQGVSSIDIAKTDLRGFEGVARKYGVDYAIRQDRSTVPPKYLVFFKAKDADALTAAFNEYSAKALQKSKRPSVLKQLRAIAAKVAELPGKVVNHDKKRELDR